MNILLKSVAIVSSLVAGVHAMEVEEHSHAGIPQDITDLILGKASTNMILDLGSEISIKDMYKNVGKWQLVCKDWKNILDRQINDDKKGFFIKSLISAYKTIGHGDACKLFLDGGLRYTPNPDEVDTYIDLFIADLEKPFAGEFDLKACGDAWKHLSICTGYRKKNRDIGKVEIHVCPWFVVNKDIAGPANHYKDIFTTWKGDNAPVGIFFSCGEWVDLGRFDHVTNKNVEEVSNKNLLKLYEIDAASHVVQRCLHVVYLPHVVDARLGNCFYIKFHFFKQKLD